VKDADSVAQQCAYWTESPLVLTLTSTAAAPISTAAIDGPVAITLLRCLQPGLRILNCLDSYSELPDILLMKTTVDIPDDELADAMRFTRARTKREAIVTAITEFNRRRRMAELIKHAGTCSDILSADELQRARRSE